MNKIDTLRSTIDALDAKIMSLLDKRFDAVKDIGAAKREANRSIEDASREKFVLEACGRYAHKEALRTVYKAIFESAKALQKDT